MMMALGMYVFSLPTLAYQELQRRSDWRHARNPRVGARDATQFVGPGQETITLSGTAVAELQDGVAEIDTLTGMAGQGEAWPLVDGTGLVYGAYVITGVDERHRQFFPDGRARQIDFAIDLLAVDPPSPEPASRPTAGAADTDDGGRGQGSLTGEEDQGPLTGEESDGGNSPGSA